jgi:RNA polymerase sigma-70 factor (ECF subfamily)
VNAGDPRFPTTHWSVVRTVSATDPDAARQALACLCETYWYPLYAYVRRSGRSREDSEDLTQAFFARLLDKRDIAGADPRRGSFRAYLIGAVRHFLANERARAAAERRGGGRVPFPLDFPDAEPRSRPR